MQFFVRSAVVSGLLALGVPVEKAGEGWNVWLAQNSSTSLDNISADDFAKGLEKIAESYR